MTEERDVDPEMMERIEDDFQRALRGDPRPVPRVPGIPTEYVEDLVETFAELYRYDPDSKYPRNLHEATMRVVWARLEPELLGRLKATGKVLEELEEGTADPVLARRAALRAFAEEAEEVVHQFVSRLAVEAEIVADGEEMVESTELIGSLKHVLREWEPLEDVDP